jgi:hypothetical protein
MALGRRGSTAITTKPLRKQQNFSDFGLKVPLVLCTMLHLILILAQVTPPSLAAFFLRDHCERQPAECMI